VEIALDLMAHYAPLPRKAPSTESGYKTALGHWRNFIATKQFPSTWLPQMSEAQNILNEFATYLVKSAKKSDGEPYSLGFVLQVLSGTKEMLKKKYPEWSIWDSHTGRNLGRAYGWYDEIRYAMTKAVVSQTFESGDTLSDVSIPIGIASLLILLHEENMYSFFLPVAHACLIYHLFTGRKLLKKIIQSLWKSHDIDSLESCAIILINFVTVGRAGEAAFTSWKSTFYDSEDDALVLYSPMPKVMSAKHITLYNDSIDFELDPYFHLACYWIMGGGRRHMSADSEKEFEEKEHWIFPSMALKSNPCRLVNERLRTSISSMPTAELSYDVTSVGSSPFPFNGTYSLTSLRDGAVSLILNHEALRGPMHGVCRSGHDHTNICSVFEYFWMSYVSQCQAGRALAGWANDPVKHGQIPSPDISTIMNNEGNSISQLQTHNFIIALFKPTYEGFNPTSPQWVIMTRCFATFIMHLGAFENLVGNTHPIVKKFRSVALSMDIDSKTLRHWSDLLLLKWDNDKKILVENTKSHPIELVEILPRIMAKLDYTATRLERVEKQLAELTDANKDALVKPSEATHHTPSPLRKNRRISHTNVSSLEGAGSTEAEQAAEQAAEQESAEKMVVEKQKLNAFDVMKQSSKRHNFYNVDSLAQLTIDQVLKDFYQFHLHENTSFSFSSKDNAKNISMIRLVVRFSLHCTKESLGNSDVLITQLSAPMPESDSTDFFAWNKNRDAAAVKICEHAMKKMLEIEQHVEAMKMKVTGGLPETNNSKKTQPRKAFVSGLYKRITKAHDSGFFNKDTLSILFKSKERA